MTIWYRYLDRLKLANKIVPPTVIKVGLDQSLFAPFFLATFFVTQGIMSRKGWDDLKQDFSQVLFPPTVPSSNSSWTL